MGTGILVEKKDVLGDGDWVLAADLLDVVGKKVLCVIRDGSISRQNTNCLWGLKKTVNVLFLFSNPGSQNWCLRSFGPSPALVLRVLDGT